MTGVGAQATATGDLTVSPDSEWNRDCLSYSVIAPLADDAVRALAAVQRAVADAWPTPLHLCPAHSFHITVHAPAGVRVRFDKDGYWREHGERGLAALRRVCAAHPSFGITYTRILVSSSAIIAVAADDGSMQALRKAVAAAFPPSPVPVPPPDIIHTTLARHASDSPVPRTVANGIVALPLRVEMAVSRLSVVRERVYPLLAADVLDTVPLAPRRGLTSPP